MNGQRGSLHFLPVRVEEQTGKVDPVGAVSAVW